MARKHGEQNTITKIQTFVNKCLRWIVGIRWIDIVTNVELWRGSQQEPVSDIIRRRKWRWIGHILRRPVTDITRHALSWNPAGKRKRGRPRNTWQRSVEDEAKKVGKSWPQIRKIAKNRVRWRIFVDGLCSALIDGHK